jgi:hypothetical protein
MLFACGRRRSRNLFVKFLVTLSIFLIISFIIHSDSITITVITNRKDANPRLFCILLNTHSTHEQFVLMNNITWAKRCYRIGIVRYKRLQTFDDGKFDEIINSIENSFKSL